MLISGPSSDVTYCAACPFAGELYNIPAAGQSGYRQLTLLPMSEALVDLPDGRCRCRVCNAILGSPTAGKRHYEVSHTHMRRMLCSLCGSVQKNKYSFGCHLNLKHAIKGKDVVKLYGEFV